MKFTNRWFSQNGNIQLSAVNNSLIYQFSLHFWLNLTYPAESVYTPQTAYVIPIHPQFLIQIFQAGKTVYYGKCSCTQDDMRGGLILFYATRPISGIVAIARIVNRYIGTPNKLYNDLGMKGVLTLEENWVYLHCNTWIWLILSWKCNLNYYHLITTILLLIDNFSISLSLSKI